MRSAGAVLALALLAAIAPSAQSNAATNQVIEMPNGLKYTDNTTGTGTEATAGKKVSVHYTGWLYNNGAKGAKFDSSVDRGQPFQFTLGAHQVIAGWDEGVAGMKVGVTMAMIGVIVGEFITAQEGLGYIIMFASSAGETATVLAAIVLLCGIGLALFGLVALGEIAVQRWYGGEMPVGGAI